jgi:hypothetical protein
VSASNRAPAKAPNRQPVKASSGRPAGLFTWLAIGLVVVVVATLVIIKVASGSNTPTGSATWTATDATTAAQVTGVPASVFNTVGITSPVAQVSPPLILKGQPALTATSGTGATLPEVYYLGAEYCPYCAAQRWATIAALSRFGTFTGLGNTASYSKDVYPNTQSFTFLKTVYTSKYLVFKAVEAYTNIYDPTTQFYTPLQKPTAAETALLKKYDTPKYIAGMTSSDIGSIPFIDLGNKFLVSGASYSPDTLTNLTRTAIATGLSDPTSPVTDAIIASANYQTAALCTLTNNQPGNVCTSSGVMAAAKAMKIK